MCASLFDLVYSFLHVGVDAGIDPYMQPNHL